MPQEQSTDKVEKILCLIQYDGSQFHGWQQQINGVSVQSHLLETFTTVLRYPDLCVHGASRTDTGVHACAQAATVQMPAKLFASLDFPRIQYSLNQLLRPFIRIEKIFKVPVDFQVRFDAQSKYYIYALELSHASSPFFRQSWHVGSSISVHRLKSLLQLFSGERDFSCFSQRSSLKNKKNTVRNIYRIKLIQKGSLLFLLFWGNGFLHKQIRMMVGSAVKLAKRDDIPLKEAEKILGEMLAFCSHDKFKFTAPPRGLYLHKLIYSMPMRKNFILLSDTRQ